MLGDEFDWHKVQLEFVFMEVVMHLHTPLMRIWLFLGRQEGEIDWLEMFGGLVLLESTVIELLAGVGATAGELLTSWATSN